ncbi:MAG: hypothetical protein ACOYOU_06575, partial [Kiritimatiellia bacterium]
MIFRMTTNLPCLRRLCAAAVFAASLLPGPADAASLDNLRRSAVKIYVTVQRYDYMQPWQA